MPVGWLVDAGQAGLGKPSSGASYLQAMHARLCQQVPVGRDLLRREGAQRRCTTELPGGLCAHACPAHSAAQPAAGRLPPQLAFSA